LQGSGLAGLAARGATGQNVLPAHPFSGLALLTRTEGLPAVARGARPGRRM